MCKELLKWKWIFFYLDVPWRMDEAKASYVYGEGAFGSKSFAWNKWV